MRTTVDTWTRRRFLKASGVSAAGVLLAGGAAYSASELLASGDGEGAGGEAGVLVLVTLYGGNDGLNTVVPAADPHYRNARPDLAYGEDEVLPLGEELGLNPGMKGFHGLWKEKRLAVVRGVSYPKPDHSHFRSMAIWQTASPESPAPTGWLGRWLDAQSKPDPLTAVSLGATLPPVLAGEKVSGAAVSLGRAPLPDAWQTVCTHLAAEQAGVHPLQQRAAATLGDLVRVDDAFAAGEEKESGDGKGGDENGKGKGKGKGEDGAGEGSGEEDGRQSPEEEDEDEDKPAEGASAGGQSGLAAQLGLVERALASGARTRVYCVSLGGFDTHANEKGTQSRLLARLDQDLSAFLGRIRRTEAGKRVVVAVHSEFGRRVGANAGQGTDHGTAGPVFLLGEPVRGGFYGDQPSLAKLVDGDLSTTTDFRDVYATLLDRVLDTEPGQILDGHEKTLAFL
ncbi:hypothetical protein SLNWT_0845 [Streptomyces albus]|uniref:DUF1501 domain-containing protein n=1 Tax=Streptomyces albus (strain ATCC 21838 / DSM 41398 / FERM P-419 / JCM 4703 / NBRC 107858) TaxID=1081613 RepID=A0A0B5ER23_STRA4|nr:hypothetical protein SLNWT_0845 [Streptomyces albus]AOU75536.1 hypothetical protein SLNHY_0845 [Streptomyces albus]